MKPPSFLVFVWLGACAIVAATETGEDLQARYQVILDRVPFGIVPPGRFGQGPLGFGRYAFVGLVSPDGESSNRVAVIHDRISNTYHFKAEGEQIDDVKVLRLENTPSGRKLLLQRGSDIMTLTYAQPVTPSGAAQPNPFGQVKAPNPFGPPPPVVTADTSAMLDRKAAARERAEAAKQANDKRSKESSKRTSDTSDRRREKPVKSPVKR